MFIAIVYFIACEYYIWRKGYWGLIKFTEGGLALVTVLIHDRCYPFVSVYEL